MMEKNSKNGFKVTITEDNMLVDDDDFGYNDSPRSESKSPVKNIGKQRPTEIKLNFPVITESNNHLDPGASMAISEIYNSEISMNPELQNNFFVFDEKTLYQKKYNILMKMIAKCGYEPTEFEKFMMSKPKKNRKKCSLSLTGEI